MSFFNNLYITLIVIVAILVTIATTSCAIAHPSTQPHHHEKSVLLGEYHFIVNQSDEKIRFVLKNNQTLMGVCTQIGIPIDTCSRSILL